MRLRTGIWSHVQFKCSGAQIVRAYLLPLVVRRLTRRTCGSWWCVISVTAVHTPIVASCGRAAICRAWGTGMWWRWKVLHSNPLLQQRLSQNGFDPCFRPKCPLLEPKLVSNRFQAWSQEAHPTNEASSHSSLRSASAGSPSFGTFGAQRPPATCKNRV